MPTSGSLYGFLIIGGMLAVTPGPNMVYVMSRSIAQGRTAGLISLAGVMVGYLFYMFGAAFGITTLFLSVPHARTALGVVGAAYLLYLAWQAVRPGGRSPFDVKALPSEHPLRLLAMGATTSVLNPKLAMLFVSLLPQFIDYRHGSVFGQSLLLGSLLIAAFAAANGFVAICSSGIATFLRARPALLLAQRWAMGAVLGGLGMEMLVDAAKMATIA
ncbi:LysE family translocator [Burkholderia sp. AU19243]|uniref:LysE family translocator n=1 Tax=Burkholderia TaxID=32008 RepID=UPI00084154AA|nr:MULTISPECIES: LysE family translocator [Burkholderia]MBR7963869.1 LysE family translocator [Burkholderia vietnamiensis]AOK06453.1 lysine transporter LysE [Burkholderia latens]MBR8144708.1 LysE family translocator [Burkholderia vietnamiensis]MBR8366500.1 LysE family translocator [Burkholderia sp. AU19243]MBY4697239.1 LysE family translocator [Burkholderia latens]